MTKSEIVSSVAEYLTFITATGESQVNAIYADENVWLSKKMMAQLYDIEVPTINYHLKKSLMIMSYQKIQLFEIFE